MVFSSIQAEGIRPEVLPEKITYQPGERVRLFVKVEKRDGETEVLDVQLVEVTELADELELDRRKVMLGATNAATYTVEHSASPIEFGRAVVLRVLRNGTLVAVTSEYYTVAREFWSVAICGDMGGPIANSAPYSREQIRAQIERLRRQYANWFEKMFWAPDDWGLLTPEPGSTWYSAQAARHESESNLRYQIACAHEQGIKVMTYGKNFAGGWNGWEMARKRPQWFLVDDYGRTRGRGCTVWDLDNWQKDKPGQEKLNHYRDFSAVWTYRAVNLALEPALDHGINELIGSARQFGFDGVRFDSGGFRASWLPASAMEADAVNTRNMKRLKERLWTVFPDYLFGYNTRNPLAADGREYPLSVHDPIAHEVREMLAGGGLWMGEALREDPMRNGAVKYRSWRKFAQDERRCIDTIRRYGGHFIYSYGDPKNVGKEVAFYRFTIGTMLGAHPYANAHVTAGKGWPWGAFLTRWCGFFWDPRIRPVERPEEWATVESVRPVWWREFANERVVSPTRRFLILNLFNPPEDDTPGPQTKTPPPAEGVRVRFTLPSGDRLKRVWFVAPGPANVEQELPLLAGRDGMEWECPTFPVWAMVIFEMEGKGFQVPERPPPMTEPLSSEQQAIVEKWRHYRPIAVADDVGNPTPQYEPEKVAVRKWPPVDVEAVQDGWEDAVPIEEETSVPVADVTSEFLTSRERRGAVTGSDGVIPPEVGGSPGLDAAVAVGFYYHPYRMLEVLKVLAPDGRSAYCPWMRYVDKKGNFQAVPRSLASAMRYDLIVLVNMGADELGQERMAVLAEYVRRGGTLLVLGGPRTLGQGFFKGSPLEEVLPVEVRVARDVYQLPAPRVLGRERGAELPGRPMVIYYHAVTARPDAQVHLWAGDLPIFYSRRVGKGRSFVFVGTVLGEEEFPEATVFWKSPAWPAQFAEVLRTAWRVTEGDERTWRP